MSAKIRTGDEVVVLVGSDRGKVGKIIKIIFHNAKKKAVVSGINVRKRHVKSKVGGGTILSKELAIDISNVAILDRKYKSPTRVGFKVVDGKKLRFAKVSGELLTD